MRTNRRAFLKGGLGSISTLATAVAEPQTQSGHAVAAGHPDVVVWELARLEPGQP